jgi:hypothetical protein
MSYLYVKWIGLGRGSLPDVPVIRATVVAPLATPETEACDAVGARLGPSGRSGQRDSMQRGCLLRSCKVATFC